MPVDVPIVSDHVRSAFLRAVDQEPQRRGDFIADLRAMLRDAFSAAMADAG